VGFKVGQNFDLNVTPPQIKQAFERGSGDGKALLAKAARQAGGEGGKDWVYTTRSGVYGVDYVYRAAIALCCLGENLPQDAVYPTSLKAADGHAYDGANKYVMHFPKGKMPPVSGFWSLTMYELPQSLLVANEINRYLINSPMLPQLVKNADGGLTLYVQNESPGRDKEPNWLPAPKGPFAVALRLYWPKPEALDGKWRQPPMTTTP